MNRAFNRIVSCLMSLVLAAGLVPAPAFAQAGESPLLAGLSCGLSALADEKTVTFGTPELAEAVAEQLTAKGVEHQRSGERSITLDVSQVTELDLSTKLISSLEGLSAFTSLERLDLSHNCVRDIGELEGLTALVHLDLYDNYVHDFEALSGHVKLAHLNLGENNELNPPVSLANLDAINTLKGLTWLDFSQNHAPGITAQLEGLPSIEYLNLQENDIIDLDPLKELYSLKTLILSHNKVCGVAALLGLSNLETLDLNGNQLYKTSYGAEDTSGLRGVFTGEGAQRKLVWPNLTKLDIANNWDWFGMVGNPDTRRLLELDRAREIELGYTLDRIYEYDKIYPDTLVKYDGDVPYVTYDDFGARHDGVYDDFNAMRVAHDFANKHGCEVRATPGVTYHIFRPYDLTYYSVYTDVDWKGAEFVIHDEGIDGLGARYVPLLCLRPTSGATTGTAAYQDIKTIAGSLTVNGELNRKTTSVSGLCPELDEAIGALGKDYDRFYVEAFNDKTKQYKRFGMNANNGYDQRDGFIVDKNGKLEAGQAVQWDFGDVTKFVVTPIPKEAAHIRNGTFLSTKLDSKREAAYSRPNDKPIYYLRNLQLRDCANVEMNDVKQVVGTWVKKGSEDAGTFIEGDDNDMTGSNNGFIQVRACADVKLTDCSVWTRRYGEGGRSTYGLSMTESVNLTLTRFDCSNPWEQLLDVGGTRWGVMGTSYCKHVTFDRCTVNRIDAHEGFYDMEALDCKLGSWGFRLTGQGPLAIERCDVYANSFIMLRGDYGSTWDGDARIVDCTHHCIGEFMQGLLSVSPSFEKDGSQHQFGYEIHCPNLYVENYTVDYSQFDNGKDGYCIIPNYDYDHRNELMSEGYWPNEVEVDGVHFVNYADTLGYEPHFRFASSDEGTISGKLGGYSIANVTFDGAGEHAPLDDGELVKAWEPDEHIYVVGENPTSDSYTDRFGIDASALAGREVAVEFGGVIPRLAFMDKSGAVWAPVEAYYATQPDAEGNRIAYYSKSGIDAMWESRAQEAAKTKTVGPLEFMQVQTTGREDATCGGTHLRRVVLLDAPAPAEDPKPGTDPQPGDDPGTKTDPQPGGGQETGPTQKPDPGADPDSDPNAQPQPDADPEQGAEPDPAPNPNPNPNPDPHSNPIPGPGPGADGAQPSQSGPATPAQPSTPSASEGRVTPVMPVYHLVNRKKGAHAYAVGKKAFALARKTAWSYAGVAFSVPRSGAGAPVLELVKKKTGARYYTTSEKKARSLAKKGWKRNGVAFRSLESGGVDVYRMKKKGAYQLVKGRAAMKKLKKKGWANKGVAFRAR